MPVLLVFPPSARHSTSSTRNTKTISPPASSQCCTGYWLAGAITSPISSRRKHTPGQKTVSGFFGDFHPLAPGKPRRNPLNRIGKSRLPLRQPRRVCAITATDSTTPHWGGGSAETPSGNKDLKSLRTDLCLKENCRYGNLKQLQHGLDIVIRKLRRWLNVSCSRCSG